LFISLIGLVLIAGSAAAQDPKALAEQREAIKKLDNWVGEWQGTGWTLFGGGGKKQEFKVTETVQSKLDGLVLFIEGVGRGEKDAAGKEFIGHNALALVSFDDKTKTYRFKHHTAAGRHGEEELKVTDGGFEWGINDPNGVKVRFLIKMDGKTWTETGEFSRDGTNWIKVLDMTLTKQPAKAK
jgi:hypothetical protein